MAFVKEFFSNTRKPTDTTAGRWMLKGMNFGHRSGNNWAFDQLPTRDYRSILDVGCGGGQVLSDLHSRYPSAQLAGVDYSPAAVAATLNFNQDLVDDQVLLVEEANVANLPFPDSSFDLVTACETIYFWPDLVDNMREVRRTLKRDGIFLVACETDNVRRATRWTRIIDGMKVYTREQIADAMEDAGFLNVEAVGYPGRAEWICVYGTNPQA